MNIHHFEIDTNDCDMIASDLQAGKTAVAKGKKITGTGKAFEFATYGVTQTNVPEYIPVSINVVEITSLDYPVKSLIAFQDMPDIDFSTERTVGVVLVDNVEYPITMKVEGIFITFNCEKTITLQSFYGKDNYYT
jgi:hypothetical protein